MARSLWQSAWQNKTNSDVNFRIEVCFFSSFSCYEMCAKVSLLDAAEEVCADVNEPGKPDVPFNDTVQLLEATTLPSIHSTPLGMICIALHVGYRSLLSLISFERHLPFYLYISTLQSTHYPLLRLTSHG